MARPGFQKAVKLVAIVLIGTSLATGCVTAGTSVPAPAVGGDEANLLTRYTLSQCLAAAYPGTAIERDARAAAGGYLEFGNLPIEAYEEATARWPKRWRHARTTASMASRCTR